MSEPINDGGNDGVDYVLVDEDDDHHDFVDDVCIDVDVDDDDDDVDEMYMYLTMTSTCPLQHLNDLMALRKTSVNDLQYVGKISFVLLVNIINLNPHLDNHST